MLFYHLTTHVDTDKDQELLGFLSDRVAFPTVLYMTHEGDVLHKHVGDRTTRSFQKEIHGYYQLHLARKDLAAGRSEARIKILENQLKLGLLSHEAALKSYLALDPKLLSSSLGSSASPSARAKKAAEIRQALIHLEAKEVYFGVIKGKTTADRDRNRAQRAHKMLAAGRIPTDANAWRFWKLLVLHAQEIKSRKLFERAAREYLRLRRNKISPAEQERIESLRAKLQRSR